MDQQQQEQPDDPPFAVRGKDEIIDIVQGAAAKESYSAETCVRYEICVLEEENNPRKALSSLEVLRKASVELAQSLTTDYIWQRDSFKLEVRRDEGLLYLQGVTDHGDCVEDEWLIVYILVQISKRFPNTWIRVADDDGEFLLIEAASAVPKWLSPENDAYRPWIHNGKLLIIPTASAGGHGDDKIQSLAAALAMIKSSANSLVHSPLVEAETFYRLEKYPARIKDSSHCALVTIPRKLAAIIHERPQAIAPIVEAVYFRDPITMKPLLSPSAALKCPPVDLVTVSVRFTKMLFAQLRSQRFPPFPSWQPILAAAEAETGSSAEATKKFSKLETGMKLACGFEIMAVTAEKSNSRVVREVALILDDLEEDGDDSLPTDDDIKDWGDVGREDDDSWLDIDYDEFERELGGGKGKGQAKDKSFGDATAQADLRKIVERFEAFLNDDEAGADGAEVDAMDEDDDDDHDDLASEDGDSDEDDEDGAISFDEQEFQQMMREMMGLPDENGQSKGKSAMPAGKSRKVAPEEEEEQEIHGLAAQMEAELNALGALKLGPGTTPRKAAIKETDNKAGSDDEEDDADGEVDLDYNLAKNLLESFKGQAGIAGPAGNILGMLGMSLPRDDGDDDDQHRAKGKESDTK